MADCVDITGVKIIFPSGQENDMGTILDEVECCLPKLYEFVFSNDTLLSIRIDNEGTVKPGLPYLTYNDAAAEPVAQVSGYTTGIIPSGERFSIFINIDPGAADCLLAGDFSLTLNFDVEFLSGAVPSCNVALPVSISLYTFTQPVYTQPAPENEDSTMQLTAVVGSTVSKTITITNGNSFLNTYKFTQPAQWDARFSASLDIFNSFDIDAGNSIDVIFSYTPTAEELDCMLFEGEDLCEKFTSFTICFEAVKEDSASGDGGGGSGSGGIPPCDGFIDCNSPLTDEQILRSLIYEDINGCPAIQILLT